MSSNINILVENPYGEVTIPRAKLRPADGADTVIVNPMVMEGKLNTVSSAPQPYVVKEAGGEEDEGRRGCCYRCRRRK